MTAEHSQHGFSLVELLVVVVILAVLAGLAVPALGRVRVSANQAECLSNQRQIGIALHQYAADHAGEFPQTTHSAGLKKENAWIFKLKSYLENVDKVRVCPADPPKRQKAILALNGTSYVLNDMVFDSPQYNNLFRIPCPSCTFLMFILSEDKAPSTRNDHIHGAEWASWETASSEIEIDRHRMGARASDRLNGSANYLFADGHARNIPAAEFKALWDSTDNPAEVPTTPR